MTKGLRTIVYKVTNLTEAKSWYGKAFEAKPYFDEPFYVGFNIGGYELGLLASEAVVDQMGNATTYWGVDDIEKSIQHFLKMGATEKDKIADVGGDVKVASVKDPWGNVIGLIYNPDFKLQ